MNLTTLFDEAKERKASDLHLASGETPCVRIAGKLVRLDMQPLDRAVLSAILEPVLPMEAKIRVDSGLPVEKTVIHGDLAFVGIFFRSGDDGIAATFRMLSNGVPPLEQIGEGALPLMNRIAETSRGLVLVTGPTGSGKWTTVCSILDKINGEKAARLFVVESHPNFRFGSKQSLVTQLHVGQDCDSYTRALEIAQQADLDVVALDDIPTAEALRQMLILAETGHLVIANMHADSVVDALQRLLGSAGSEAEALRRSLAQNLVAVTSQRLFPRAQRSGRVPAYSWISANPATREALLTGDLARLEELQGTDPDCQSLNATLDTLVAAGEVTEEAASIHRA
ncbi:type IV pilus twitching motility protein PilT [Fimbriimonas ginsengisoli]|nr:ATPase, T2SS/T4P/T4SS family [Fimbriimonas ginsengisoli]